MEIDHIDTNKDNNNLSNLRLVTRTENVNNPLTIIHSSKPIKQFDKKGNFIKIWDCAIDAANELNIDRANINHCCNHKPNHKTAGGFIWRYENDNSEINTYTDNSIVQLDLNNNLIEIFKTAVLASTKTGISTCSISNCCNHKINDVKGFKFIKYKEFVNT